MRALNARGAGAQSAPTEPVTASLPPGAPTGVLAVASAPATATVSWLAPADDGGTAVVAYTVTSAPEGLAVTVDGDTTSAVVPGLTPRHLLHLHRGGARTPSRRASRRRPRTP